MEAINGVTFKDYACASANLVAGMPLEQICEVLGIELPVWEATQDAWNNKMAELSIDDMAFYGKVFTNPKQGKFANVENSTGTIEDVLTTYPKWSDYLKMGAYMSEVSNVGIDIDFDKEFGISLTEYAQLASHWSAFFKEKVIDVQGQTSQEYINDVELTDEQKEASKIFALHSELTDKWNAHYKEKYKSQNVGLTDDIDF